MNPAKSNLAVNIEAMEVKSTPTQRLLTTGPQNAPIREDQVTTTRSDNNETQMIFAATTTRPVLVDSHVNDDDYVQISPNRIICPSRCGCSCYTRSSIQLPRLLQDFFGSLAVNYYPGSFPQVCNEPRCAKRTSRATVSYTFPLWLLNQVLFMAIRFECMLPSISPHMMRVCSPKEMGINFWHDNIDASAFEQRIAMKLSNGQLTICDVLPSGTSLLHVGASLGEAPLLAD